ncbi:MAG: hypothetical protein AAGG50_03770 [Bacteroidota bacterium]
MLRLYDLDTELAYLEDQLVEAGGELTDPDTGYVIAWAKAPSLENADWREHHARWAKANEELEW